MLTLLTVLAVLNVAGSSTAAAAEVSEANTVDVLVVYTPTLRNACGGHAGVKAKINEMISETNKAYEDSGINARVRLAGWQEINYYESPISYTEDLDYISDFRADPDDPTWWDCYPDGVADEVHDLREQTGADCVVLFREGAAANTAGLAWMLGGKPEDYDDPADVNEWRVTAFAVVGRDLNYYAFAHELGHNMGMSHDRATASNTGGLYNYSYGYVFTVPNYTYEYGGTGSGVFLTGSLEIGTIMAYPGARWVGIFANPNKSINGVATGVASGSKAADAARTLHSTIPTTVALYTPSVPPAPPLITPGGGAFAGSVTVALSDSTPYCDIYYTLDGSEPSELSATSIKYTAPFTLTAACTVKARAFKTGYTASATSSATFATDGVSPVIFSPQGGDYTVETAPAVSLTCATAGTIIRYTLDGSAVSTSSSLYSAPLQITRTTTIRAKAWNSEKGTTSMETTATYRILEKLAPPSISPAAVAPATVVEFVNTQRVTITPPATPAGVTIRYTTNGAAVTASSYQYTSPFDISAACTIKARAFHDDYTASDTVSVEFKKVLPPTPAPTLSATGTVNPNAAGTPNSFLGPATINITPNSASDTIRYTLDGSDVTENSAVYTAGEPLVMTRGGTISIRAFRTNYYPSELVTLTVFITPVAAPAPTITPNGGAFREGVDLLTISCPTAPGAEIRYTLDGSEPTTTSTLYTAPFTLLTLATVKAKCFHPDFLDGETTTVVFDAYVFGETLAPVVFNPPDGTAARDELTVSLSCATTGAVIRYTLNNATVTEDSPLYDAASPLHFEAAYADGVRSLRINAKPFKARTNAAPQTTANYTITPTPPAPAVVAHLIGNLALDDVDGTGNNAAAGNTYLGPVRVIFDLEQTGDIIRYTLDGTEPSASSPAVTTAAPAGTAGNTAGGSVSLAVSRSATLKARVFRTDHKPGPVFEVTLTIIPIAVATPVISPAPTPPASSVEFAQSIQVRITCADSDAGAVIRYTLDGSEVTESSTIYSTPFSIYGAATLSARAFLADYLPSETASVTFVRELPVTPAPAVTLSGERVSIADGGIVTGDAGLPFIERAVVTATPAATTGDTIRYTLDGSDVTESSAVYTTSLSLGADATVRLRAFRSGRKPSDLITVPVVIWQRVSTPLITPAGGEFADGTAASCSLYCPSTNATIRYTLNGEEVTINSAAYVTPLSFKETTTVRAKAFLTGSAASREVVATFTKLPPAAPVPSIAVAGERVAVADGGDGSAFKGSATVTLNLSTGSTVGSTIRYTLDGSPVTAESTLYSGSFTLTESATINARVFDAAGDLSPSATVTLRVVIWSDEPLPPPTFSPAGGTFVDCVSVSLAAGSAGDAAGSITTRYTLDGSAVTNTSSAFTEPLTLAATGSTTFTLRARNFAPNHIASQETVCTFSLVPAGTDDDSDDDNDDDNAGTGNDTGDADDNAGGDNSANAGGTGTGGSTGGTSTNETPATTFPLLITRQPAAPATGVLVGDAFLLSVATTGGSTGTSTAAGDSTGTGDFHYQWFRDDTPLDDSDSPVFHVASARATDTGDYTVTITAPDGQTVTSEPTRLIVTLAIPTDGSAPVPAPITTLTDATAAELRTAARTIANSKTAPGIASGIITLAVRLADAIANSKLAAGKITGTAQTAGSTQTASTAQTAVIAPVASNLAAGTTLFLNATPHTNITYTRTTLTTATVTLTSTGTSTTGTITTTVYLTFLSATSGLFTSTSNSARDAGAFVLIPPASSEKD